MAVNFEECPINGGKLIRKTLWPKATGKFLHATETSSGLSVCLICHPGVPIKSENLKLPYEVEGKYFAEIMYAVRSSDHKFEVPS